MGKAIKKLLKAKEAKPKARPVYGFWNPYEPEWLQQKNLETQRDMIAGEDATTTADGGTRAEESGTQYMRDAGLRAPSKDGPAAMSILSPFLEVDGQPESRLVRRRVAVVQGDVGVSEAQDGGKQNKSASKGKDPRKNGARHKNARGGGGGGGGAGRVATRNNRKPPAKKKNVKSSKKGAKG